MESLEKLIKKETNYMFNDVFYQNFSKKILDFVSENKHLHGYVYFIKNGKNGNKVKIGNALDIDKRVSSYNTAFYNKVYILGYIKSEDYIFLEKDIHSFLSDKNIKGEWYEIDLMDMIKIKESYDFISINDFYNSKIKIEKMESKHSEIKNSDIIDFCKTLKTDRYYNTTDLFKKFSELYPENNFNSISWFGRELNNSLNILGYNKKTKTDSGIRTFKIF